MDYDTIKKGDILKLSTGEIILIVGWWRYHINQMFGKRTDLWMKKDACTFYRKGSIITITGKLYTS